MAPTDTWKLTNRYIRPRVGDQFALGYYHNFRENTSETSVEGYFKTTRDFVDYKSGAVLILNHRLETGVLNAQPGTARRRAGVRREQDNGLQPAENPRAGRGGWPLLPRPAHLRRYG